MAAMIGSFVCPSAGYALFVALGVFALL